MNVPLKAFQSPWLHLADELSSRHDRQVLVERIEHDMLSDADRLFEMGEYARLENVLREIKEKLS